MIDRGPWKRLLSSLHQPKPPRFAGQVSGYVLGPNTRDYVNSRYGPDLILAYTAGLPGIGSPLLMNTFRPGVGCCTLTALTRVFDYYQHQHRIIAGPLTAQDWFDFIEHRAVRFGYSRRRGRTNPLVIAALARAIWRHRPLPVTDSLSSDTQSGRIKSGTARTTWLPSAQSIISMVQSGRPGLLNIACGYYQSHTVTVVGCQIWQRELNWTDGTGLADHPDNPPDRPAVINLVEVQDGWTSEPRWIDLTALTHPLSGDYSLCSLTQIWPPETCPNQ